MTLPTETSHSHPKRWRKALPVWVQVVVLLIVFASGIGVGGVSATHYVIDRMQHYRTHPEVLPEEITQSLARRLRLTAEQQSEILEIISRRHARIEEARQAPAPEIHSEFDLMEQEVAAVLEGRQKQQWLSTAEWVRSSFLPLNPQASGQ
ncbi:MAG: hypothetical protein KDB22_24545 [Planctomycetales bacterium]|nr:hypothetical protein [Planctomycetales bacterium]